MGISTRLILGTAVAWTLSTLIGSPARGEDPFNENVRTADPQTAQEQQKKFKVPPGFEVQLVAAEPDVHKPLNMAIDAKGRLWVTHSIEYPFPAQPGKGRDKITIYEDFGPDGRARKITDFASNLNIPDGIYPYKDGCIAFTIPNITFFHDTDGDGKADKSEVLYGPFDTTRDTHGMNNTFRRGYDGWLYANHGFNNQSRVKGADGQVLAMNSGNTYRMRLDGSHLEIFAHQTVNPFGGTFDELGNYYTSDCHSWPITNLIRGATYTHFGNPHDGLGFGPAMMNHQHGGSAIAGLVYYDDDQFPAEFRHNFLVGNPLNSRIFRDTLEDRGSTRWANAAPEFLTCGDSWFRPVDIQLAPDGSLFIGDFYNRIIGHYEVPLTHPGRDRLRGRIWRVVYNGPGVTKRGPIPDLSTASAEVLVEHLAHPNSKVRMLAMDQITDRLGTAALDVVKTAAREPKNPTQQVHAMWLLYRFGAIDTPMLSEAATNPERLLRVHAMRILAELPQHTRDQHALVLSGLTDSDALVQRCAADALSLKPNPINVRPLLECLQKAPAADTHLRYALRLSLRNQLQPEGAFDKLAALNLTDAEQRAIADVCPAIASEAAGNFLVAHIARDKSDAKPDYLRHAARYAAESKGDAVIAACRQSAGDNIDQQLILFKSIQEGASQRGKGLPAAAKEWAANLTTKLLSTPTRSAKTLLARQQGGAELAMSFGIKDAQPQLQKVLNDRSADAAARAAAAKALATLGGKAHAQLLAQSITDAAAPIALREQSAQLLSGIDPALFADTITAAVQAAPQAIQSRLALTMAAKPEGANKLFEAISAGKVSARLLQDPKIKERLAAANIKDLDVRIANLTKGLAPLSEATMKIIEERRAAYRKTHGNADEGQKIFVTNCSVCHQINKQGNAVGPNLDGIGSRGADRLIEDILDPNRNVDPNFYYSIIDLKDGTNILGLQKREEGETFVLADATGKEIQVKKGEIKKRAESKRSLMPDNFHELLKEPDFYNLIAYLESQRPAKP